MPSKEDIFPNYLHFCCRLINSGVWNQFTIDLKDNPFCDNLVQGFLLSEVKMNGRV